VCCRFFVAQPTTVLTLRASIHVTNLETNTAYNQFLFLFRTSAWIYPSTCVCVCLLKCVLASLIRWTFFSITKYQWYFEMYAILANIVILRYYNYLLVLRPVLNVPSRHIFWITMFMCLKYCNNCPNESYQVCSSTYTEGKIVLKIQSPNPFLYVFEWFSTGNYVFSALNLIYTQKTSKNSGVWELYQKKATLRIDYKWTNRKIFRRTLDFFSAGVTLLMKYVQGGKIKINDIFFSKSESLLLYVYIMVFCAGTLFQYKIWPPCIKPKSDKSLTSEWTLCVDVFELIRTNLWMVIIACLFLVLDKAFLSQRNLIGASIQIYFHLYEDECFT